MKTNYLNQITKIGMLAALFCVLGPITIPMKPIPMTLQPFTLSLITVLLPFSGATTAILIYLLLGAVGLPVFSNYSSGLGHFAGVTGGFLFGFAIFPIAYNLFVKLNLIKNKFWNILIGLALSHATLYLAGSIGMVVWMNINQNSIAGFYTWAKTILVPYYLINVAQSIVVVIIYKVLEKHIKI